MNSCHVARIHMPSLRQKHTITDDATLFEKAFQAAEIANLTVDDHKAYDDGLKYYRDFNGT